MTIEPARRAWYDRLFDALEPKKPVELSCAGVKMKDGRLSYRGVYQPVEGSRITVGTAGAIRRRPTLTRTIAGGIIGGGTGAVIGALLTKGIDDRELFMVVEGSRTNWTVKLNPHILSYARRFADEVNAAAK